MTPAVRNSVARLPQVSPWHRIARRSTILSSISTRTYRFYRSSTTPRRPTPARELTPSRRRSMAATNHSSPADADLDSVLREEALLEVWDYWFSHIPSDDLAVLPRAEYMKRWFMGGEEFDQGCIKRFRPLLETLQSVNPTPQSIVAAVRDAPPRVWLSLILLLDQVPRNCYRGAQSAVVFNFFDPLARAVAQRAIDLDLPSSAGFKYFIGRRMWFYLPLMHSEDLQLHDVAVAQYRKMGDDIRALLAAPVSASTEQDRNCGEIFAGDKDATENLLAMNYEFEIKHRDIIAKFGRYPHRNGPLGREMTSAEQDFIDNGGDTFGAKG